MIKVNSKDSTIFQMKATTRVWVEFQEIPNLSFPLRQYPPTRVSNIKRSNHSHTKRIIEFQENKLANFHRYFLQLDHFSPNSSSSMTLFNVLYIRRSVSPASLFRSEANTTRWHLKEQRVAECEGFSVRVASRAQLFKSVRRLRVLARLPGCIDDLSSPANG